MWKLGTSTGPISEAIQHWPQILIVVTCLSTYYMCTKFQGNLKWVVIFHVEHLWNDPNIRPVAVWVLIWASRWACCFSVNVLRQILHTNGLSSWRWAEMCLTSSSWLAKEWWQDVHAVHWPLWPAAMVNVYPDDLYRKRSACSATFSSPDS